MHHNFPDNRRQFKRSPISIAVKESSDHYISLCQANDISTHGIFLARAEDSVRPPLGGKCWLEFSLPGSDVYIKARGTVVRHLEYNSYLLTAVAFATIAPSHQRMIREYVSGSPLAADNPVFLPPQQYSW